jgi:myo-inositol-1-phosphate synthase
LQKRRREKSGGINVAIIGVGNCASSLVQGVHFYRDAPVDKSIPGIMHPMLGGYHIGDVNFVEMLPKTRSGKIMRRVLKAVVSGRDPGDVSTIEDEGSVEEARDLAYSPVVSEDKSKDKEFLALYRNTKRDAEKTKQVTALEEYWGNSARRNWERRNR